MINLLGEALSIGVFLGAGFIVFVYTLVALTIVSLQSEKYKLFITESSASQKYLDWNTKRRAAKKKAFREWWD